MITTSKRRVWTRTSLPMWLLRLICVAVCTTSANADEVDAKINEINSTLRKSKVEAATKALEDMRAVAADLVKKGDPRKDQVLARVDELAGELEEPIAPGQLREWEKAFEAIDGRGGWWWIDPQNPDRRGPWYRLDRPTKRFVNWNINADGKPMKVEQFCANYRIIGVDPDDQNIILVKVTYTPQGLEPGKQDTFRFNKKTGVLQTAYGWYGKPK